VSATASAAAFPPTAAEPLLRLRNVEKSYHLGTTRVPALRGVSLDVGAGEFVALVGPSGSGKSTLLAVCGLLDRPDAGSYLVDGRDTAGLSERERAHLRRDGLGFVFQGFNLLPALTAFENVEIPLLLSGAASAERAGRVADVLEQVGLGALGRRRPDELSGGQRQRVAIARALVNGPRLVLADEPTANLDSATATQVVDLMHELGRSAGATFLVATHDPRMAARCDRQLALADGVLP
jgi:putative ABC transport system ATP-binding protein